MNSRLRSVISETSRGLKTSLYLALPVEIISNFQIILVIFNNIFSAEIDKSDFPSRFTSFITSNIGSFDFLGVSSGDNAIIEAIWVCIILYFVFHLLLIIFAIITYSNQPSARKRRLLNMISIMFLLHSRVIFFFLHYFLMGFISSYINCDGTDTSFECKVGGMAISIVLILINFAFSLVKELLLYDINKNKKNPNAIKTNLFHTMMLLHKALAIALYFLLQDPSSSKQVNIAINICLLFVSVAILYIKFPFYNFTMLKASVMTTGAAFGFAAVSIAGVTDLEDNGQTILWITSAPLIMKSALLILNRLSDRIMNGEFDSPEKAIHFVMRLNAHNFGYVPKSLYPLSTSHVSVIVSNGMFVQKKLNMNAIKECKSWKEYEEMIYSYIIDRLNPILEKNPTSELLLLFIARIYFKKLENIPKALMLIKRVESSRLSIPLQNSIEAFNVKFMETQMRDSHDNRHDNLYVIEYFKERALSNLIKEEIQYEIQKHLEFWDAIRKDRTNVIKVIDISYQIEDIAVKIQNRWQNQIKGTIKHFLNSLIMYGAYLDIIKEHADEAKKLIQRYWNLSHNPHQDQALDVYSEDAAVVLVTIEKTNFGVISDASGSAQSLFRREKQKLIGQNLTSLVPSMVGENLLSLLDKYAKKPTGRLNYSLKSYGKTGTGEFFEADIHLKLFPEISRQVKIMIIFQKLAVAKPIVIVDDNGDICEYTQGLRQIFNFGESSMSLVNMQKIAPEFPRINDAFNRIYNSNAHIQESSTIMVTSQSPARVSHTRHLATEEKGYKQTHESHKERRKSVSANKLVLLDELAQDQYKRVCNEFVQGSKLRFVSVSGSAANIDEAEVDVQITPLEMNEELYKIIVLNFSDEKEANAKLEVKESQTDDLEELFSDFAAEFPEADEREGKGGHKKKNLLTSKVSKYREEASGLERRFTRFTEDRETEDAQKIPSKLKSLGSLNAMNVVVKKRGATTHDEMFEMAKMEMREGSVSSTSSRTVASIRALKNLFNKSQSYTLARRVRIAIFAIMLFMAILAATNFILSRNAVSSVKTGVNLINIASLRLEQSMRAWQFAVRFFLRKIGLRSGQIQSLKDSSYTSGRAMLEENKLLYEELSEQVDVDLFNDIIADDVNLWIPYENKTIDGKQTDTFTATNVLATKILYVANTSEDINAPKVLEQIQFVANNSGNDFLISSEEVITSTQKMLKKLISKNISNLQLVLILQIVAIVLLCLCLLIALRVIMQSYRILFRALVKIDEKSVTHRIQQIHRIKTLFHEDIDTKKFGSTAVDILRPMDGDSVKVKAKAHKTGFHIVEERIQMRGLLSHLIKHVGFSLLVIQVITILFIVALTKSIANFRSLDNVNNQLSVTTQVAYETSAIISTFYVEMVWRNDTTMLVRNELPRIQVPKGIDALTNVNQDLVAVFTDEDGISDPLIKDIFQSSVCKYLSNDTTTQTYCENATQTGTIGILAINSQFYLTAQFYSAMYFANPTWANAKSFIDTYILTMRPCAETLESAYEFINAHILDGFNKTISNFNEETTVLHVGILIAVLFSTIVIQKVCVNRLGLLDMRRGIILRAISFQILLQDKAISFYLNRHFISTNNALSKSL